MTEGRTFRRPPSSPGHEWDGPSQAAANGSGRLSLFPDADSGAAGFAAQPPRADLVNFVAQAGV